MNESESITQKLDERLNMPELINQVVSLAHLSPTIGKVDRLSRDQMLQLIAYLTTVVDVQKSLEKSLEEQGKEND